jgi:C-terminal processing protease CtpA/Prc
MFKKIITIPITLLIALSSIPSDSNATQVNNNLANAGINSEDRMKMSMLWEIEDMHEVFKGGYAPAEWKESYYGWNLNEAKNEAYQDIKNHPSLSEDEYQKIAKKFFNSTKDYHVGIYFCDFEAATLPFTVGSAEGRYFVNYVNEDDAASKDFPFEIGDEIIRFDDRPIDEVVQELKLREERQATEETDQAFAEMYLTSRQKVLGINVPSGEITIEGRKKNTNKIIPHTMEWSNPYSYNSDLDDYDDDSDEDLSFKREKMKKTLFENLKGLSTLPPTTTKDESSKTRLGKTKKFLNERPHSAPIHKKLKMMSPTLKENPNSLGNRESVLPKLGKILWEGDENVAYDAYLYESTNGMKVGYVRIPEFGLEESDAKDFEEIITRFEEDSDVLLIDQVNNPGGSIFHMYALASMLIENPIQVPHEHYRVPREDAAELLFLVDEVDAEIEHLLNNPEAELETIDGFPLSLDFLKSFKEFWEFLVVQATYNGGNLSELYNSFGVETIQPHPKVHYSKPILMLINPMDISCGDFFPALFQDSDTNMTLLGARTSGAGGAVVFNEIFSERTLGMSYTWTIAMRPNGMPIENIGVHPDVPYEITVRDLTDNYKDYQEKIEETLENISKKKKND